MREGTTAVLNTRPYLGRLITHSGQRWEVLHCGAQSHLGVYCTLKLVGDGRREAHWVDSQTLRLGDIA